MPILSVEIGVLLNLAPFMIFKGAWTQKGLLHISGRRCCTWQYLIFIHICLLKIFPQKNSLGVEMHIGLVCGYWSISMH